MRTQVINDPATAVPRLERIAETGQIEQVLLESFPFTIGRNGDCDFQIESPKVSRQHAVITEQRSGFRIEDLGSTNGTSVNGCPIQKAELADGDIVMIADVEFTFDAGRSSKRRDTVTMVIGGRGAGAAESGSYRRLIREVRRVHEMLTHGAVRCRIRPIMDLPNHRPIGFQAGHPGEDGLAHGGGVETILATDCRLAEQLCYLNRLIVAEESQRWPERTKLFVRLHQSEIGGESLGESLESLSEVLNGRHQLVVTIAAGLAGVSSYFAGIRRRLAEIGALVAYEGFEAGPAQLKQWSSAPPEFIKLAPSLVRGVAGERQRRQLLASLLEAAADLRIGVVATDIRNREDLQACRDLRCPFGEGPALGTQAADCLFGSEATAFQALEPAPIA